MKARIRSGSFVTGIVASVCAIAPAHAEDPPIQAGWKVQQLTYSHGGFTTAYDCDAAAEKIKAILVELGAHPTSRVVVSGCPYNRPSRSFFVQMAVAIPVPAAEAKLPPADQSKQELLKRLGKVAAVSTDEFPAVWTTVELSKSQRINLRPGDCELMEGLRDDVLPKLGMKVMKQRLGCRPNSIGVTTPELSVSALIATKSPDAKTGS